MRVFEALADEIVRAGVTHVFTLMSQETTKLTCELLRRGVSVYHTRHEHVAVGMADGYARSSGRLALAIVGEGPGLTNSMNALITALKADSSVVVVAVDDLWMPGVSPDVPMTGSVNKAIDQPALLDALRSRHVEIRSAETAASDFRTCLELAGADQRFLIVGVAYRILEREAGRGPSALGLAARLPSAPKNDDIAAIADLVETEWTCRRPVIVAGRGSVRAGARDDLLALGDQIGALMGTTMHAKGLFHGSSFDIGVVGSYSTPVTMELLRAADVVLAFGAALTVHTTYARTLFPRARVVHVDVDPDHIGRYLAVDLGVVADAREAARALVVELERRGHKAAGYRSQKTASRLELAMRDPHEYHGTERGLDPRAVARTLDRVLPTDRTIVLDAGNHVAFPIRHVNVTDPSRSIWPIEYSAVGCALGVALGSAVARPDRLTVLWVGDGGLMMNLSDLHTAVRYALRLLVVVANDSGFGAERHYLRQEGYGGEIARYENPSFEAMAGVMGIPAMTITSTAELDAIGDRLPSLTGPVLLDCRVDDDISDAHGLPHQGKL